MDFIQQDGAAIML